MDIKLGTPKEEQGWHTEAKVCLKLGILELEQDIIML